MNYRKLGVPEAVARLLGEQAIDGEREQLMFLEQYKYSDRQSMVGYLADEYPNEDFVAVDSVERDGKFRGIELKYKVIVVVTGDSAVEILYDRFYSTMVDTIELESVLNSYQVTVLCLTPMNFVELYQGTGSLSYDPMQVFKRYLFEAVTVGATDIHFDVKHHSDGIRYPVSFRISNELQEVEIIPVDAGLNKNIIGALVAKKTTANELDLLESSGVVASAVGILGNDLDLRISVNSVRDGYHYVIRIQKKTTYSMSIDQLGFNQRTLTVLHRLTKKRSGITLITGAIRTGKNTTAFALANEMVKEPIKIVSYESPIEVLMPFTQVDYKENQDILLNSVRLAKKQDVNIAFINEIPNKEVAFAVQDLVNSSVHVITTMHMNRIWHLPYKLREYYGSEYKDVISQINCVINQKMFAQSCPYCSAPMLTSSVADETIRDFLSKRGAISIKQSCGCIQCGKTGKVPRSNQPYAEFVVFDDTLVSYLLRCDSPAGMEAVLREAVRENSLETFMFEGIVSGKLSWDSLETIM